METVAESWIMILVYVLFVSAHYAAPCLLQFVSLTTHANIHRCDMFQHLSDEVSLLCLEVTKNQMQTNVRQNAEHAAEALWGR